MVLTGSGMKDLSLLPRKAADTRVVGLEDLEKVLSERS